MSEPGMGQVLTWPGPGLNLAEVNGNLGLENSNLGVGNPNLEGLHLGKP